MKQMYQPRVTKTLNSSQPQLINHNDDHEETGVGSQPENKSSKRVTVIKGGNVRPVDLINLQRTLGNQAVQRLLVERKAKPKASNLLASLTVTLEKAVVKKLPYQQIDAAALAIYNTDAVYYNKLLAYKLEKHKSDEKGAVYGSSMPPDAFVPAFEVAWTKRMHGAVGFLAESAWIKDPALCKEKGLDPVLGTKGDNVAGAIHGKFEFNNGTDEATEIGGKRRLTKVKDGTVKASGAYGITTAWKLTLDG